MSKRFRGVSLCNGGALIRYVGDDALELLLFLAEYISSECKGKKPVNLLKLSDKDNFIVNQIKLIHSYLKLLNRQGIELKGENRLALENCLSIASSVYHLGEFKEQKGDFEANCSILDFVVDKLVKKLRASKISCDRKDSISTCSAYLFPDYHTLRGIRVSDHTTEECSKFKHNIIIGVNIEEYSVKHGIDTYGRDYFIHYTPKGGIKEVLEIVLESTVLERDEKIEKLGEVAYTNLCYGNKLSNR